MDTKLTFEGLHALIVEDEKLNALIARKTLERWGIHVSHAENGLEAMSMTRKQRFDFILMDIQMPIMDGLTATKNIRSEVENPNCQSLIWALTAYATDETRISCNQVGMNYFLTKPLDADLLYRLIHRHCIELVTI